MKRCIFSYSLSASEVAINLHESMVLFWLVFLFVASVIFLLWNDTVRPIGFPPGPQWFPWFGNSFLVQNLSKKYGGQHGVFEYLSRKYGSPVIGLRQGRELTVAILDYALGREILTSDDLLSRPDNLFVRLRTFGNRMGLSFTDGNLWKEHRMFTMAKLKQLGYGHQPMEDIIQMELYNCIQMIQNNSGPSTTANLLDTYIVNSIWVLIAGTSIEEQQLQRLLNIVKNLSPQFDTSGGLLTRMPWLRFLAPVSSGHNLLTNLNKELRTFLQDIVEEHRKNFTAERASDDLVYCYLQEIANRKGDPNTTFIVDQLVAVLFDLFIAASQNISAILEVLLLTMINRPDIQAQVHAEIDRQHPCDRYPRWSNRNCYPYSQAVIQEAQRFFHIFAMAGPRRTTNDIHIGGFTIPKNTTVFVDLKSIHMDPNYWTDPQMFHPERFLNATGDQLVSYERFIPFSLGKRRCPGDVISKSCLFSFFVGLMQDFQVCSPEKEKIPQAIELIPGMTYSPKPYRVIFTARKMK